MEGAVVQLLVVGHREEPEMDGMFGRFFPTHRV
jgi:hypothetical protein